MYNVPVCVCAVLFIILGGIFLRDLKRKAAFLTAVSVVFSSVPVNSFSDLIVHAEESYTDAFTYYKDLEEFSDIGIVTDSSLLDFVNIFSPAFIDPADTDNGELSGYPVTFRNPVQIDSLIAVNGSTYFNYNSAFDFSDGEKFIVYGDLKAEHDLRAVTEFSDGAKLWDKPSVMCAGNISSRDMLNIGSEGNPLNVYCQSITASMNPGNIYGNVFITGEDRDSEINGKITGNLFSSGSVSITANTVIEGDLAVKGILNVTAPLTVKGRLCAEGGIIGNEEMITYAEKADSCDDMVFDAECSDKLTFGILAEEGFNGTGTIIPPVEVFKDLYSRKKERCLSLYEDVKERADNQKTAEYDGGTEISGSVFIPAVSRLTDLPSLDNREIHVTSPDGSPVYITLGDGIKVTNSKIIVDDSVKECYIILGENGAEFNHSVIMSEKYYSQISEGYLSITEDDEIGIRIVGPDCASVNSQNSSFSAHSYVQFENIKGGFEKDVSYVEYRGREYSSVKNFTVLIGSLADCTTASRSLQQMAYGNIYYVKDRTEEPAAEFRSASLTLKDGVTLNYTISVSEKALEDTDGMYAVFKSSAKEKRYYFSEWQESSERGKYIVSIPVRPDHMTDVITAEIYDSKDELVSVQEYSVKRYLDTVLEKEEYIQCHDLCTAMLRYGARAQAYTGFRTEDPAYIFEEENNTFPVFSRSEYGSRISYTGDQIRTKSASVLLGANTSIAVKFTVPEDADLTFKCTDPQTGKSIDAETEINGTQATVIIRDIRPQDFDVMYHFSVSDGSSEADVDYSVYTYIFQSAERYSDNTSFTDLLYALWYYGKAADNYFITVHGIPQGPVFGYVERQSLLLQENSLKTAVSSGTQYFKLDSPKKDRPAVFTVTGLDEEQLEAYVYKNNKVVPSSEITSVRQGDTVKFYITDPAASAFYLAADCGEIRQKYSVKAEYIDIPFNEIDSDTEVSGTVTYKDWSSYKFTAAENGVYRIKGSIDGPALSNVSVSHLSVSQDPYIPGKTETGYKQVYSADLSEADGKTFVLAAGDTVSFTVDQRGGEDSEYTFEVVKPELETQTLGPGQYFNAVKYSDGTVYKFTAPFDGKYCIEGFTDDSFSIYSCDSYRAVETGERSDFSLKKDESVLILFSDNVSSRGITFADDFTEILASEMQGTEITVRPDSTSWLKFTPDKDGTYLFYGEPAVNKMYSGICESDHSVRSLLLDSHFMPCASDPYRSVGFTADLRKGETYYLGIETNKDDIVFSDAEYIIYAGLNYSYALPDITEISEGEVKSTSYSNLLAFTPEESGVYTFENVQFIYANPEGSPVFDNAVSRDAHTEARYTLSRYIPEGKTVYLYGDSVSVSRNVPGTGDITELSENSSSYVDTQNYNCWRKYTAQTEGDYTFLIRNRFDFNVGECVYITDENGENIYTAVSENVKNPSVTVHLKNGETAYVMPYAAQYGLIFNYDMYVVSGTAQDTRDVSSYPGLEYIGNGRYIFTAENEGSYTFGGVFPEFEYGKPSKSIHTLRMYSGEKIWLNEAELSGIPVTIRFEPCTIAGISEFSGRIPASDTDNNRIVYRYIPEKSGLIRIDSVVYGGTPDYHTGKLPSAEPSVSDAAGNPVSYRRNNGEIVFAGEAGRAVYIEFLQDADASLLNFVCLEEASQEEMKLNEKLYDTLMIHTEAADSAVAYTYDYSPVSFNAGWYRFTAPENGTYEFFTPSGQLNYQGVHSFVFEGSLYSDINTQSRIDCGAVGDRVLYYMNAGETVYYKVKAYARPYAVMTDKNMISVASSVRMAVREEIRDVTGKNFITGSLSDSSSHMYRIHADKPGIYTIKAKADRDLTVTAYRSQYMNDAVPERVTGDPAELTLEIKTAGDIYYTVDAADGTVNGSFSAEFSYSDSIVKTMVPFETYNESVSYNSLPVMYKLTADSDTSYKFTAKSRYSSERSIIRIYNENRELIKEGTSGVSSEAEYFVKAGETIYIRVFGNEYGGYSLRSVTETKIEREVVTDTVYTDRLASEEDEIWYVFNAPKGDHYYMFEAEGDFEYTLSLSGSDKISFRHESGTGNVHFIRWVPGGMPYYIRVIPADNEPAEYSFKIRETPLVRRTLVTNETDHDSISYLSNKNYTFTAPYDMTYVFEAQSSDTDIFVQVENVSSPASPESSEAGRNVSLKRTLKAGDSVNIRVKLSDESETGNYSLIVRQEKYNIQKMDQGEVISGVCSKENENWYSFTAERSGKYRLNINCEQYSVCRIYDDSMENILYDYRFNGDEDHVIYLEAGQTVYMNIGQIYPDRSSEDFRASLTYLDNITTLSCDTAAQGIVSGEFSSTFKFCAPESGEYVFVINSDRSMDIRLYRSEKDIESGAYEMSGTSSYEDQQYKASVSYSINKGDIVYLKAYSGLTNASVYDLTVGKKTRSAVVIEEAGIVYSAADSDEEQQYFEFTAPESGVYCFENISSFYRYTVYNDRDLTDAKITFDNYSMTDPDKSSIRMKQGQTVYIAAEKTDQYAENRYWITVHKTYMSVNLDNIMTEAVRYGYYSSDVRFSAWKLSGKSTSVYNVTVNTPPEAMDSGNVFVEIYDSEEFTEPLKTYQIKNESERSFKFFSHDRGLENKYFVVRTGDGSPLSYDIRIDRLGGYSEMQLMPDSIGTFNGATGGMNSGTLNYFVVQKDGLYEFDTKPDGGAMPAEDDRSYTAHLTELDMLKEIPQHSDSTKDCYIYELKAGQTVYFWLEDESDREIKYYVSLQSMNLPEGTVSVKLNAEADFTVGKEPRIIRFRAPETDTYKFSLSEGFVGEFRRYDTMSGEFMTSCGYINPYAEMSMQKDEIIYIFVSSVFPEEAECSLLITAYEKYKQYGY